MKLALLDDYQHVALKLADWSAIARRVEIQTFHAPFAGIDAAAAALADFDILCIMRERLPFPRALLERLPKLKCLVTTGSMNFAVDLAAARDHGVLVCGTTNGPGRRATAELTWGLVLAAARHIVGEDRELRAGRWQTTLGTMLDGKTLGIISLGHVGGMVARYARVFGMRVLAWSANLTAAHAAAHGAERVEKDALLGQSDIVSIHTILGDRTRALIGEREFALMKTSAILVNTSRGPIVDEAALISALAHERIAGAALDVFDREPLPMDHPLRNFPDKVILTPHVGYVAEEVYRVFYQDTVDAVQAWLDGRPMRVLNAA